MQIEIIELFNKGFLVNNSLYIFYDKIESFELIIDETGIVPKNWDNDKDYPKCIWYVLEINTNKTCYRFTPRTFKYIEEVNTLNNYILDLHKKLIELIIN